MDLAHAKAIEDQFLVPTYARVPLLLERGKGVHVYDSDGKRYLDFITGIGVNALGHAHPRVLAAIRAQSRLLIHSSNLYLNEYQGRLAQRLTSMCGMERAFFTVGGAESVEGAIKIARALGQQQSPEKIELVTLTNSFHGRTCGALAITGQPRYRAPFGPLIPGVRFVETNNEAALREAVSDRTCGIFIEPVQGEGGIHEVHAGFMRLAADLARQHHATLVFDEIQCGLGRTGKPFAFQWTDVVPDVVLAAKPIACGYPLGAILARGAAANALGTGTHGTTFGGGPLACRLGLEFLDELESSDLYTHILSSGAALKQGLETIAGHHAFVKEVRGKGLMVAMEINGPAAPYVKRMMELGLLANVTHETTIRMLPPYIVEPRHITQALSIVAKAFKTAAV